MIPSPREVRACLDPSCDPINMAIADAALKEGSYSAESVEDGDCRSCSWMRFMYRRGLTPWSSGGTGGTATVRVKLSDAIRRAVLNPLEVVSAPLIGGGLAAGGLI
jgi:hypothetical protein